MAKRVSAKTRVKERTKSAISRRATHGSSKNVSSKYQTRRGAAANRNAKKKALKGADLVKLSSPKKKVTGSMLVSVTRASKGTSGRRGRSKLRKRR